MQCLLRPPPTLNFFFFWRLTKFQLFTHNTLVVFRPKEQHRTRRTLLINDFSDAAGELLLFSGGLHHPSHSAISASVGAPPLILLFLKNAQLLRFLILHTLCASGAETAAVTG